MRRGRIIIKELFTGDTLYLWRRYIAIKLSTLWIDYENYCQSYSYKKQSLLHEKRKKLRVCFTQGA